MDGRQSKIYVSMAFMAVKGSKGTLTMASGGRTALVVISSSCFLFGDRTPHSFFCMKVMVHPW